MQSALDLGNRILMMDSGDIVLDIHEEEKKGLTVEGLAGIILLFSGIQRFITDVMAAYMVGAIDVYKRQSVCFALPLVECESIATIGFS